MRRLPKWGKVMDGLALKLIIRPVPSQEFFRLHFSFSLQLEFGYTYIAIGGGKSQKSTPIGRHMTRFNRIDRCLSRLGSGLPGFLLRTEYLQHLSLERRKGGRERRQPSDQVVYLFGGT